MEINLFIDFVSKYHKYISNREEERRISTHDELFAFERTISRLNEMQGGDYLIKFFITFLSFFALLLSLSFKINILDLGECLGKNCWVNI